MLHVLRFLVFVVCQYACKTFAAANFFAKSFWHAGRFSSQIRPPKQDRLIEDSLLTLIHRCSYGPKLLGHVPQKYLKFKTDVKHAKKQNKTMAAKVVSKLKF